MSILQTVMKLSGPLRDARRLLGSGVFDAHAYSHRNPDVPENPWLATLHYCRYGRFEQRESGQAPLSRWLTPYIMSERIPAARIREMVQGLTGNWEGKPPESDVTGIAERFGLDEGEFWFHLQCERQDIDAAYDALASLPMELAFLHHYFFARRHLRMEGLLEAHQWSVTQLDNQTRKSVDFYIAAREIADAVGYEASAATEFHRRLVTSFSNYVILPESQKWRGLWQVGYPVLPDGSGIAEQLLREVPDELCSLAQQYGADKLASVGDWSVMLNLQSLNMLTGKDHCLSYEGGRWQSCDKSGLDAETVDVRVLGEGYWRLASDDPIHRMLLDGFRTAAISTSQVFPRVCPRPGTLIFDVRRSLPRPVPTLSYHTIASQHQRYLNFKESALPGYFLFDRSGYSGWATGLGDLDIPQPSPEEVEAFFAELRSAYVDGRVTKYDQAPSEAGSLTAPYVLIALQVPDDTVSTLAHITTEEMIEAVARYYEGTGIAVAIKAHPLDASDLTRKALDQASAMYGHVYVTKAPIFDLLAQARAVVTVNSGVGMEALLYLKPVITTGDSDYAECTYQVCTVYELGNVLANLEETLQPAKSPAETKAWLYHYFKRRCFRIGDVPLEFRSALESL